MEKNLRADNFRFTKEGRKRSEHRMFCPECRKDGLVWDEAYNVWTCALCARDISFEELQESYSAYVVEVEKKLERAKRRQLKLEQWLEEWRKVYSAKD